MRHELQPRSVTVVNLVSRDTIEHRMLGTLEAKQGLSEGVLDLRGDLSQVKLRGGGQAFLTRLEQVIDSREPARKPAGVKPPLPVDRSATFASRAAQMLNGHLVSCEERFPVGVAHSVLVVVVERNADTLRETLKQTHDDLFGPGRSDPLAPVQLEVIDRATAEALKRLTEAGLIQFNVRATRHLHPAQNAAPEVLTDEEKQKLSAARDRAARKLKVARLLVGGEMLEDARPALEEAVHHFCAMRAVENRLPDPVDFADCLRSPWDGFLGNDREVLKTLGEGSPAAFERVLRLVEKGLLEKEKSCCVNSNPTCIAHTQAMHWPGTLGRCRGGLCQPPHVSPASEHISIPLHLCQNQRRLTQTASTALV